MVVVVPDTPLPSKMQIGIFMATIYHKEQKTMNECGNCRQLGHVRKNCPNEPICYDCGKSGHKEGSEDCEKNALLGSGPPVARQGGGPRCGRK